MTSTYGYSRWDGTQRGFDLEASAVAAELADDLVHHGDPNAALRRLLRAGMLAGDGRRLEGTRAVLEQLRRRRRQLLDRHALGEPYRDAARRLRQIVDLERAAVDDELRAGRASSDPDRRAAAEEEAARKGQALDLLPPDPAGQMNALVDHQFTSPEAAARFAELVRELRNDLTRSWFDQMAAGLRRPDPAELQRTKDMLADLNRMLELRVAGEEPGFDAFMDRYGDLFPEAPSDLDELLDALARRAAASRAMTGHMTAAQRDELQALYDQLLSDLDLRWELDRLGVNLRSALPDAGLDAQCSLTGAEPLDLPGGREVLAELGDLDRLEQLLEGASDPGALAEVDLARARQLLGDESAESLAALADLGRLLAEAGLIERREGRYRLTPRGVRRIGQQALADLFGRLSADRIGRHELAGVGRGPERAHQSRPYEYGDPFDLDVGATLRNALARAGPGTPVRLTLEDFEVEEAEALTAVSTVLMLDVSLSMAMRDSFLAAKKVAMALHALISARYPRDDLAVVTFGKLARELRPEELPAVSWDYDYGTNVQHGLLLSRRLLARRSGTRQIVMITDGEPTAHIPSGASEPFFSYPPAPQTLEATLAEADRCTRAGIRINTFMLDPSLGLRSFVEQLTRLNRGRAFFTNPSNLGQYVLVDFMDQRRATTRRGA